MKLTESNLERKIENLELETKAEGEAINLRWGAPLGDPEDNTAPRLRWREELTPEELKEAIERQREICQKYAEAKEGPGPVDILNILEL